MKHLIIGGHDGVSFAMCGKDGTGPDFADRQPEEGDCPGCLEVWRECDPDAIKAEDLRVRMHVGEGW